MSRRLDLPAGWSSSVKSAPTGSVYIQIESGSGLAFTVSIRDHGVTDDQSATLAAWWTVSSPSERDAAWAAIQDFVWEVDRDEAHLFRTALSCRFSLEEWGWLCGDMDFCGRVNAMCTADDLAALFVLAESRVRAAHFPPPQDFMLPRSWLIRSRPPADRPSRF
jgi:hypothetical protein